MIIDRHETEEYPYDGEFYTTWIDESKPLDQQKEEDLILLKTKCDIQEAQKSDSGNSIKASFNVYFPFDKSVGIKITRGVLFRGNMYGMRVDGMVLGLFPTQLSGCAVYLTDNTSSNLNGSV